MYGLELSPNGYTPHGELLTDPAQISAIVCMIESEYWRNDRSISTERWEDGAREVLSLFAFHVRGSYENRIRSTIPGHIHDHAKIHLLLATPLRILELMPFEKTQKYLTYFTGQFFDKSIQRLGGKPETHAMTKWVQGAFLEHAELIGCDVYYDRNARTKDGHDVLRLNYNDEPAGILLTHIDWSRHDIDPATPLTPVFTDDYVWIATREEYITMQRVHLSHIADALKYSGNEKKNPMIGIIDSYILRELEGLKNFGVLPLPANIQ